MIRETLKAKLIEYMKAHDAERVGVVRMLISAINNKEIAFRAQKLEMEDKHILKVVKKEIKQRQDSIESYEKGNRQDLADAERAEMVILEEMLAEFAPQETETPQDEQ